MLALRRIPRLCRSVSTDIHHLPSSTTSLIPLANRDTRGAPDGESSSRTSPHSQTNANLHTQSTRLPANSQPDPSASTSSSGAPPPPPPNDEPQASSSQLTPHSSVPSTLPRDGPSHFESQSSPPFHTHAFFTALEKTFPTPTARSLMRATRALLVDRIGRVRREGLTGKDLDNVSGPLHGCRAFLTVALIASVPVPRSTL